MVRRTSGLIFYFKNEAVIMGYNNQFICFHSYNIKNKNELRDFASKLKKRRNIDISYVYSLAEKHEVPSFSITRASVEVIRDQIRRK